MNSKRCDRFAWPNTIFLICLGVLFQGTFVAAEAKTIRIEDSTGASVTVGLPIKRLVVLTSDAMEIVRALGASDLVVGVYSGIEKKPLFWPVLKDKPKVGNWKEINYERVVSLRPDAVLSYAKNPGRELEKKLGTFGIQVIRLDFFKPGQLAGEVEALGRITGRENQAGKLAAWYRRHLGHQRDLLKNSDVPPTVYIEGDSNFHTAGPGSGGNEMCLLAGGRNIAAELSIPYPEVTPEWVVTRNPDLIVKVANRGLGDPCFTLATVAPFEKLRADIMARPAWHHTAAVKWGRVHVVDNEIWTGPRSVIGTAYLVKWFYPDLSMDVDPQALHREYLETFQGVRYQGVYVYP